MIAVCSKQLAGVSMTGRDETNRMRQHFAFISIHGWVGEEIEPRTSISATKFSFPS
jgi:hypothetical protein